MCESTLVLRAGTTGFLPPGVRPLDPKVVATEVFAAARAISARCRPMVSPAMASFRTFHLESDRFRCQLVVNAVSGLAAFATDGTDLIQLDLIDPPTSWYVAFAGCRAVRVFPKHAWETPPSAAGLAELTPHERREVAYWRPDRLVDVVFNVW